MELTIEQALQKGVAAHKDGRLQEAERLYWAIIKSQPTHSDANHNLGLLAISANQSDAALPLFKTALEANPKIEQFWFSYIDALIKEKQFDNAKKILVEAKKQGVNGEKLDALEVRLKTVTQDKEVQSDLQKKKLTFSEKRKKQLEEKKKQKKKKYLKNGKPSEAEINNITKYYQNQEYEDAERLALIMTEEFPNNEFGWNLLGAVLGKTGRYSEALNINQKAVALSPQDAAAHNNLGITLKELGRFDEAAVSYKKAIVLNPSFYEAQYNLGTIFIEKDKFSEAERILRGAIKLKPEDDEAHYNLGLTLHGLGKLDEALASFKLSIILNPGNASYHNNLGVTFQDIGRLKEAEISLTKAIELKPDPMYFQNRFLVLFDRGKFEEALKDSEFCNTKSSRQNSLECLYALGRIEEVYLRIKKESQLDEGNLRTAAFASFLKKIEKKDTGYKFCNNPMDFIHYSNISSHLEDSNDFIAELTDEIYDLKTTWEPPNKATRNGFQTPAGINLFTNPSKKLEHLKSIIIDEIESYYLKFKNNSCTFIEKWPSKKSLKGWHVILKKQGYQKAHIHPNGWLSGVIYLKVVPSLKKNEGAIEFSLNGENYSNTNAPKLVFQPKKGDIVFFPSSLHHKTIPFMTNTDRVIVSFDLLPS